MTRDTAPLGLRARAAKALRAFHEDERGELMALLLFLALAFTTSVILVVNTGRTTSERMMAQNATDAAVLSGGTQLARGMNYIATNNVTMAKVAATLAMIEALDKAIDDSLDQLEIVIQVAKAMQASVYPATVAAGVALEIAAQIQKGILKGYEAAVTVLKAVWIDSTLGERYLQMLSLIGTQLVLATPLVAQHTTRRIHRDNWNPPGGSTADVDAFLVPLYPRLPVCEGEWNDLEHETRWRAEEYRSDTDTLAAIVFLSGFYFHLKRRLDEVLDDMFSGGSGGGSTPDLPTDVGGLLDDLKTQIDDVGKQMAEAVAARDDARQRLAHRKDNPLPDPIAQAAAIAALEEEIRILDGRIEDLSEQLDRLNDQVADAQSGLESGEGFVPGGGSVGSSLGGGGADARPYLIDGKRWPSGFTYLGVGTRRTSEPQIAVVFNKPDKVGVAVSYAAVRLWNPTKADMWTPDWRAKLVRARERDIAAQRQALGGCGGNPGLAAGTGLLLASGFDMPDMRLVTHAQTVLVRDALGRH